MSSWETKNPAHLSASRVGKSLFKLDKTLLLAVLINLNGAPGHAATARVNDNIRDAQKHLIVEWSGRCH
jgi:hypothetical protein